MSLLLGMGLGRFSYTPFIPALVEAGQYDAAAAGYIGAGNLAGYLVGALALPWLRHRLHAVTLLRLCIALSLTALIGSIFPFGFAWLAFWRFLIGVTVAVMMVMSLALVIATAPRGLLGRATGTVFTGVGVGIALSGTLVPALLERGLAEAWTGLALIGALAGGIAWWGWGAAWDIPAAQPAVRRPATPPGRVDTARVWPLLAAHVLFGVGLVPYSLYWVDFIARGLGQGMGAGGLHWILVGIGALTGTLLCGWLADRIGFAAALVAIFLALGAGIALPALSHQPAVLVLSSLVFGAQPGLSAVISGRTGQVVGPESLQRVWRWMVLAIGIGQTAGGYALVALYAATGSYAALFLCGGGAMALAGLLAIPRPGSR
ncbi:MAG: YbfB/YjiJ family MFS transporter [Alphaproteobacteria bacterium]